MLIISISLLIPSLLLYKGETGWLKSFNKAKYKDKKTYSKYIGKCIFYFAIVFLINGLISLFISVLLSLIILIILIIVLIVILCKNTKEFYN